VSHDPTEITLIWCSRNIYDYYPCWKPFFTYNRYFYFRILWWI